MADRVWSEKDLVREGIERHLNTGILERTRAAEATDVAKPCRVARCGMTSTLNGRHSGSVAPPSTPWAG